MKTMFDETTCNEIVDRINKLTPETQRQWGKMNVAQMLHHCVQTIEVASGKKVLKRTFLGRILGPLIKKKFMSDKPFKQSLPTAAEFVVVTEHEFEKEKNDLLRELKAFHLAGEKGATTHPHGFFGH